jgi:hypothetical protein
MSLRAVKRMEGKKNVGYLCIDERIILNGSSRNIA